MCTRGWWLNIWLIWAYILYGWTLYLFRLNTQFNKCPLGLLYEQHWIYVLGISHENSANVLIVHMVLILCLPRQLFSLSSPVIKFLAFKLYTFNFVICAVCIILLGFFATFKGFYIFQFLSATILSFLQEANDGIFLTSSSNLIKLCQILITINKNITLYVLIMSRTRFRVNPHSIVAWMSRNSLLEAGAKFWNLSDCNWTRTHNHLVHKPTLNHLAKLAKWLSCVVSTYLYGAFDCMFLSCHVRVSEWIHTL